MSLIRLQRRVLSVLVDNIRRSRNPEVVDSNTIARTLNLSISEIKRVVKSMNGMGIIESDIEGQYSLITAKGIDWLNCSE